MIQNVEIIEVAPRDGLQNQSVVLQTPQKVELIESLIAAGTRRIEVASFVNPARVPQMADAEGVIGAVPARRGLIRIGLVLNERGAERALQTDIEELGLVVVASDTFGVRNQKQTSAESLAMAERVITRAKEAGRRVQTTIAVAFGCPFEGIVEMSRVAQMARALAAAGAHEIALADTIGVGVPMQVQKMIAAVRDAAPGVPIRLHFHNTRGTGIANAWSAIQAGVSRLDASAGGIGGCPFAPAASGNIASEDLIYMLDHCGIRSGYKLESLVALTHWLKDALNLSELPAMASRAPLPKLGSGASA
jgi:hydroxymethylglutaryl-CoA lyase